MKKVIFFFFFTTLIYASISAQQADPSFFTDWETAKTHALEHQQAILMVFAGSDWCKPCMQFKKDILQAPEFEDQMSEKLTILYLDFPLRRKNQLSQEQKAHNEVLAERYNQSGVFPKIVLMDAGENVIAFPEFKGQTALSYIAKLNQALSTQ